MRIAIICLALVAGCSSTQRISSSSGDIRTEAHALIEHGREINDPEVVSRASRIDALATKINTDVANVQDKTPAWMTMLTYMAIAVVCVATVIVLAQTGLGSALKAVLGWIPVKTRNDARLAASVLDDGKPENVREWIASKRTDPVWNRAFVDAKKELTECSTTSSSPSSSSPQDLSPATGHASPRS